MEKLSVVFNPFRLTSILGHVMFRVLVQHTEVLNHYGCGTCLCLSPMSVISPLFAMSHPLQHRLCRLIVCTPPPPPWQITVRRTVPYVRRRSIQPRSTGVFGRWFGRRHRTRRQVVYRRRQPTARRLTLADLAREAPQVGRRRRYGGAAGMQLWRPRYGGVAGMESCTVS